MPGQGPPNEHLNNLRKSYDYGAQSSPRKPGHIYSSAVEILKSNPKSANQNMNHPNTSTA